RFATDFKRNWPGTRRPDAYYDPRSVDQGDGPGAVLHAKAVVHDSELVFVTSANLTPKALERNIEAGSWSATDPSPRPSRPISSGTWKRGWSCRCAWWGRCLKKPITVTEHLICPQR
ncbi:MAG: hypothetical protein EBQ56_01820, partial [Proteobacteria bacterium]|nr:hypothetical protein [Pseudomonadota bacterium]